MIQDRYLSGSQDQRFKIIIVGNKDVGKTSIFCKYIDGQFLSEKSKQVTTIDFKIKNITINNQSVKLYIWDTAGQQQYRSIVSTYFKGCHGVIIIFSLIDKQSYFDAINQWYTISKNKSENACFMLLANKNDLQHQVSIQEAQKWCKQNSVAFLVTSVKENKNINEAFIKLGQNIYLNQNKPKKAQSFYIKQSYNKQPSFCCRQ